MYLVSTMNVFGGIRSLNNAQRGPRGFPGKSGSINDFCTFLPNTIIKQFREYDETAYIIDRENPENDFVRGRNKEILEWKNRNKSSPNLKAVHPSSELIQVGIGYALSFDKNLYELIGFPMWCVNGYGYICVTFKVDGENEQSLITNYHHNDRFKQFHEISVSHQEIIFRGYMNDKATQHTVQHNCRESTTLFLDYTQTGLKSNVEYTYILNNDPKMQGSFTFQAPHRQMATSTVGGREDGTRFLSGGIHAIEMYGNPNIPKPIPESLKQLIVKSQMSNTLPPHS